MSQPLVACCTPLTGTLTVECVGNVSGCVLRLWDRSKPELPQPAAAHGVDELVVVIGVQRLEGDQIPRQGHRRQEGHVSGCAERGGPTSARRR